MMNCIVLSYHRFEALSIVFPPCKICSPSETASRFWDSDGFAEWSPLPRSSVSDWSRHTRKIHRSIKSNESRFNASKQQANSIYSSDLLSSVWSLFPSRKKCLLTSRTSHLALIRCVCLPSFVVPEMCTCQLHQARLTHLHLPSEWCAWEECRYHLRPSGWNWWSHWERKIDFDTRRSRVPLDGVSLCYCVVESDGLVRCPASDNKRTNDSIAPYTRVALSHGLLLDLPVERDWKDKFHTIPRRPKPVLHLRINQDFII